MVKVYFGKKGTGKTVKMIESADELAVNGTKTVIFIDSGKELMYRLNHKIRFININEFPLKGSKMLEGYIYGILSCNYDIGSVFIDRFSKITGEDPDQFEEFFNAIEHLSETADVDFYISISGDEKEIPEYLKKYI